MIQKILGILGVMLVAFGAGTARAQEFEVESFTIEQKDMTARTNGRIDFNGNPCALILVWVDDAIVKAEGDVVGEVESIGLEKRVYMVRDASQLKLYFEHHRPMTVVFDTYGIPSLTGRMTYLLKLRPSSSSSSSSATAQTQSAPAPQPAPQPTQIPTQPTASPVASAIDVDAIRNEAKAAYEANNYCRALELFRSIDEDPEAQCYIGTMHRYGRGGVAESKFEAVKWYRKSAAQGFADAMYSLGIFYEFGIGVLKDRVKAVRWYQKAADQGHKAAKKALENL